MQGDWLISVGLKYLLIDALCFGQITCLVMVSGEVKTCWMVNVCCCSVCAGEVVSFNFEALLELSASWLRLGVSALLVIYSASDVEILNTGMTVIQDIKSNPVFI